VAPRSFGDGTANDRTHDALVVYAGRMANEKGVDLLVRALALVPDARLELAGDGPKRAEIERLVDELGLRSRVRFLGAVARPALLELYGRATVACVPSVCEEPFGYAVAEAMTKNTTIITTPTNTIPKL